MANNQQHNLFHGIILYQFLEAFGIANTKTNREKAKRAFKDYFEVDSTAVLTDAQYSRFISAVIMLISREWGIELPLMDAEKTMTELLNQANDDYKEQAGA